MTKHRIFTTKFSSVYPHYVRKAQGKNRTKQEVDRIICWLTGHTQAGLERQLERGTDFEAFFAQAPAMHPKRALIKGVVCGVRVEEVKDPLRPVMPAGVVTAAASESSHRDHRRARAIRPAPTRR